jgi:outer membrane receptor protein involved in Fe transport
MTRSALLIALVALGAGASGAAAQAGEGAQSPLERRITVHVRDVALRDALDRIAAAGSFRLSYSSENLPLDRRVTVWRDTSSVGEIFQELLRTFTVAPVVVGDDQVVLAPRRACTERSECDPPRDEAPITVLDRVVVTGSVLGAPERALPVALDVVAGHDIERRGQKSLGGVLDGSVPGMWIWEQAPTAMLARYGSIRGASSFGVSFPKVYIDGIEVANPLLLTQLSPELIERIEVIRGPQGAALYGSDAISGVINIVSRHDAAADGSRAMLRSEGGYAAGFVSATRVQQHTLTARIGSNLRSIGGSIGGGTTGEFVPGAYSHELRLNGDARLVGTKSTLVASARWNGKNAGVPVSPLLPALQRFAKDSLPQALRVYALGSTYTLAPNEIWTLALTGGIDGYQLNNVTSELGVIPFYVDSALRDARGSAVRGTVRASGIARVGDPEAVGGTVTLAFEHSTLRDRTFRGAQPTGGPASDTSSYVVDWNQNLGFTTQVDLAFHKAAYLTAGVRQERIGLQSNTSQLSLLPMVGGSLVREFGVVTGKARVAYGKGIRGLSASQRARAADSKHRLTNPALLPEEQAGIEAGIDLFFGSRAGLHLTRFDQVASGLIQTVAISDSSGPGAPRYRYQHQNVGEISNHGWELQATTSLSAVSLIGALTTVDSRVERLATGYSGDLRAGDRMLAVPARTLTGTIEWTHRALQISSTVSRASDWVNYDRLAIAQCWLSGCPDKHNLTGATLRNYWDQYDGNTRWRAAVAYDLRRGLTLMLTGENLLNHQRGEPDSITIVPGRTLTAGLRARF